MSAVDEAQQALTAAEVEEMFAYRAYVQSRGYAGDYRTAQEMHRLMMAYVVAQEITQQKREELRAAEEASA